MLPILHFTIERWRKNEEYGVYVSTLGRVKLAKNKQLLEPRVGESGYAFVFTERGATRVHRLVALTWLGDQSATCTIDHINSNNRDNSVKNLRWVPAKINQNYAKYVRIDSALEKDAYNQEDREIPQIAAATAAIAAINCPAFNDLFDDTILITERLNKFIDLLNAGKILIKYRSTVIHTLNELQEARKIMANQSTDTSFYTKILNVANTKNKVYCGVQWKIQAVPSTC